MNLTKHEKSKRYDAIRLIAETYVQLTEEHPMKIFALTHHKTFADQVLRLLDGLEVKHAVQI